MMLSMDYKRVWQSPTAAAAGASSSSSTAGRRPLSMWRPVGPPGYASLGDVAMPGREPPAKPVAMYKDVVEAGAAGQVRVGAGGGSVLCVLCVLRVA